jgi:SAM-dependent methyltransferase
MKQVPYDANFYKKHPLTCDPDDLWGQVRRTVKGKPVGEDQIQLIVDAVTSGLGLKADDRLLDLCCGNGALTDRIFTRCEGGCGVDFSEPLIEVARRRFEDGSRSKYVLSDVVEWVGDAQNSGPYSVALCYGSFSYLSTSQAEALLRNLWLNFPSVRSFFLGNLPDRAQLARLVGDRPWCDGDENRPDTQFGIMRTDEEITTLANKAGWHAHAVRMPAEFFAAEARYDAVLTRREVQSV